MAIETVSRRPGEGVSAWYWRRAVATPDWFLEDRLASPARVLPPLTKVHPDLAFTPLPGPDAPSLGDSHSTLCAPRGQPASPPAVRLDLDDPRSLSTFLHYAFGLSRHAMGPGAAYPYHRYVPSARCRYPTQLYLLLPATPGRDQGVYYFDALHHAVVPVAPGAGFEDLGLRPESPPTTPVMACVLTSLFWNTAVTYQHYAYRLCTQELGLTLGNIELVAAAHGLPSCRFYAFDTDRLSRTLRLPVGEEGAMAVLTLGEGDAANWRASRLPSGPVVPHAYLGMGELDQVDARAVLVLNACASLAARNRSSSPPIAGAGDAGGASTAGRRLDHHQRGDAFEPGAKIAGGEAVALAEALERRDSGGAIFDPRNEPLSARCLQRVLESARVEDSAAVGVQLRLLVATANVTGMTVGAHEWDPAGRRCRLARARPVAPLLEQAIAAAPSVRARSAPAVVFIVGDHAAVEPQWEEATLLVISAEAGAATQRLLVAAAAAGLSGRIINAFHPDMFRELTGAHDPHLGPVFTVFLGRKAGGAEFDFSIGPDGPWRRARQNSRSSPDSRPRSSS